MDPIRFVETHGVVLEAGHGVRPNLAEAIAGEPIRGSWWGHKKGRAIFRATRTVRDCDQVLVCRLVGGKITYVIADSGQRYFVWRIFWTRRLSLRKSISEKLGRCRSAVEQTLPKFRIPFQDPSTNKIVVDNADLKGQDFSIPGATNTIETC
jgi:hypothetical protein